MRFRIDDDAGRPLLDVELERVKLAESHDGRFQVLTIVSPTGVVGSVTFDILAAGPYMPGADLEDDDEDQD